ncbi:hypothetical protein NAEGRDRAFT_57719 [Naegleria gruberi]|uniref:Transglutaminase-like domain-containing protein n=1 Tax=Naegleria gruberi TaxID=5762 RepID=D2VBP8_NAEGR|nr:uncharacterized protein NAEGRDRAFT_57719 [Naegleria gruberi]EFC45833.1 hypothetical protein NAEGRDRAFT_57719 [Naegleria gruberi]|eukprot:XP_002678577.1 hypothetical protein NAEGRDRAFT_57719 [Naegleria gruberi strain NEG-M]
MSYNRTTNNNTNNNEDKSIRVGNRLNAKVGKIASMYNALDNDSHATIKRRNPISGTTSSNVTTKVVSSTVQTRTVAKKPTPTTHHSTVNSMKPSAVTNTNKSRNVGAVSKPVVKTTTKTSTVTSNIDKRDANDRKAVERKEVNDKKAEVTVVNNHQNKYFDNFKPQPFQCDASRIRKYEPNYSEIDKRARNTPKSEEASIERLAQYLTSPYNTVEEKARSLYIWITYNIDYDVDGLYSGNAHYTADTSFKSRRAVCSGYSDILKKMCDCCKMECVTISGCAKGAGYVIGAPVASNHAWSAIKTEDGQYRLIESTWGSGYLAPNSSSKWGSAFERRFVDRYFFMSPYEFIAEHFPDDSKWQLLPKTVTKEEYEKRVAIKGNGFSNGLSCVSHPYGLYTLTDSNVCEIVMKVFPGTESLINLCEEKNGTALWDAVNVTYSDNKDTITAKICFPKKNVKYSVRVFVGEKGSKLEWVWSKCSR